MKIEDSASSTAKTSARMALRLASCFKEVTFDE